MQREATPRGLVGRSLVAVLLFALAVVPGWTLGRLAAAWTGNGLLDWVVTGACGGLAVRVLAPWGSYRARDGWLGVIPLYGWYLICVLCWRVALLPYRDWEPRPDELWQARWLTGDRLGLWRTDPVSRSERASRAKAGTRPAAGHRPR
ncbi:hypothetical protein ODJ79_07925 [Actinoplanes sp. KI2]|uniref:hypothetical protein n=1 Tax=Actinoplanes sp. KI2 TaxID=2983315 RepID=UPI0021D58042|nr:hypothetical protein [Actinoplanes sp. KI2]MCU7723635.1 hypothetical protein [Actinoplanes sp. KI2]